MFSKFFCGKNESTLEALEVQWRMEYAKARRKFEKKKAEQKKKDQTKGRPPLGQLHLNSMLSSVDKVIDLTKIARDVATTREGRRNHSRGAQNLDAKKAQPSKPVCLLPSDYYCFYCFYCFYLLFVLMLTRVFVVSL